MGLKCNNHGNEYLSNDSLFKSEYSTVITVILKEFSL